jgi:hypothetical protein
VLVILVIFEIRFRFLPRLTWPMILLFVLLSIARLTGMCHHTQPLVVIGSYELFVQISLHPPNLCLPSSWDYRVESPCPASSWNFYINVITFDIASKWF